jgi:hypothetical protein
MLVNDGRDHGPVYNNNGDLVHILGKSKMDWTPPARIESMFSGHFDPIYKNKRIEWVKKEDIKDIHCEVAKSKSVYVSSTGDVFPCCYTGINPSEYRNNSDQGYSMEQISRIMSKNNALEYDLATCIEWFDQIEASWSKDSFEDGRLLTCNQSCGGSNLRPLFHVKEAEMYHNDAAS